jgi:hypothetical protein
VIDFKGVSIPLISLGVFPEAPEILAHPLRCVKQFPLVLLALGLR